MISNNSSISIIRNVAMKREIAKTDAAPKNVAPRNAVSTVSVSTSTQSHKDSFADFAQSRESVFTLASANDTYADSHVQEEFQQQFTKLADDSEAFYDLLQDAFGENYDVQAAEAIRQQTLSGDFSWVPTIEFVDGSVLGDGVGAYDSENDRILLNNDFKGSDLLFKPGD